MEQDQNTSLFGLGIDNISKSHLSEAARWAKFLAICGFIMLGLMVIYGIVVSIVFANMLGTMDQYDRTYRSNDMKSTLGIGMAVFYIICAVIAFFPYYFLLRFANKMKVALYSNDQATLNDSFMNLKILYRYMAILTIISLALIVFGLFSLVVTAGMMK